MTWEGESIGGTVMGFWKFYMIRHTFQKVTLFVNTQIKHSYRNNKQKQENTR